MCLFLLKGQFTFFKGFFQCFKIMKFWERNYAISKHAINSNKHLNIAKEHGIWFPPPPLVKITFKWHFKSQLRLKKLEGGKKNPFQNAPNRYHSYPQNCNIFENNRLVSEMWTSSYFINPCIIPCVYSLLSIKTIAQQCKLNLPTYCSTLNLITFPNSPYNILLKVC